MTTRNYGIDFLRILSMFMVLILHTLGQGGLLFNAPAFSAHYWGGWFLELAAYGAVDCFAIISGYVMCTSRAKISRLVELWFQVAFYTVSLTLLFFVVRPDTFGAGAVLNALFPITRGHYWYMSAYFGMYLLVPFLNAAIEHIDKKTAVAVLGAAFVFFCVVPIAFLYEPYRFQEGYSLIWLLLMYLVGGLLRKLDVVNKVRSSHAWLLFAACVLTAFGWKFAIEHLSVYVPFVSRYSDIFVDYTSPTVVLSAVFLFIACAKLSFPQKMTNLISAISPAALGVYLAHQCRPVWDCVIKDFTKGLLEYPAAVALALVPFVASLLYVTCTALDLFRIQLFKWMRVADLCAKFECFLNKTFDKLWHRFEV